MAIDRSAAANFVWSAARLVDRHRYAFLFDEGPAQPVVDALSAYRNEDGGFGHALEPDIRSPGSQPAPTWHSPGSATPAVSPGTSGWPGRPSGVGASWIGSSSRAVESEQQEDGGWDFDWLAWSPAQTSAWRGIVTIRALGWLEQNGRN